MTLNKIKLNMPNTKLNTPKYKKLQGTDQSRAKAREYYENNKEKQNALRKQKYHWERAVIKIVQEAINEGLTECPEFVIPEMRPLEDFYPKESDEGTSSD